MKTHYLLVPLMIGLACNSSCAKYQKRLAVSDLRCEYLVNPLGIDERRPRLSWRNESEQRGQKQTAYRLLVASSQKKLDKNTGDIWDTGKVQSVQSNQIECRDLSPASRVRYYWKVMVWDADDQPSAWSPTAHWSMGLLDPADWQAEWIGLDRLRAPKREPGAKRSAKVVITKSFYGVAGDPARQIDLTAKVQKLVSSGRFTVEGSNEFAGGDPAFGTEKVLGVTYAVDGKSQSRTVPENVVINLISGKTVQQKKTGGKIYLPAPYLRKEFNVTAPVRRAVVYATAQGFLELHINGKRVGDEYFTPGWTDYRKRIYYRSYDVTSMLKKGSNAIGAILGDGWFRGNISLVGQNQYGKLLRLKAQLHIDYADGRSETIASDPSWKASFGPILGSDMQAGETYDARLETTGWARAGFDEDGWNSVDSGSDIDPVIQAYPGVPVRKTMERRTVKVSEPTPGAYVFDLGQNFSGWIRLKVRGNAGDEVVMRFGEMLNADGTVYTANLRTARATDTYILKGGGEEVWEPRFTFHGFRYVQITGLSGKPSPEMVTGIVVHSDAPMSSSFECSNPLLNQLHSNIVWGQRSNYLEVPTDCPQRDERLGWTGDTQVFIRSGCYNQDVASFFTKWIVDLMDTQDGAGTFGEQAPVFHGHGSPAWADAGVICPWTIYKVYGDIRIVDKHYDAMARFIDYCRKRGLKGPGGGYGDWLAIGSNTPKNLISAACFAYTTSMMIEIAEQLGKKEDTAKYKTLLQDIRADFQKSFVNADGKIAGDSQTGYCLALHFNLLTDAQRKQAAAHLVNRIEAKDYHLSVGFVGVPLLLPTLTEIGRSDLAYRLIQNKTYPSWGYSIEQGATTIWERWNSYTKDQGFGPVGMNSFNHYAYGACSEWMFRSMLGIDTDGAGFKKITMKPQLDRSITWAKGHHDSIYGRIGSDWKIKDGVFEWNITIPANTTATVYLPVKAAADVTVNGQKLSKADHATFLRMEDGRALIDVGSGKYEFNAKMKAADEGDVCQASWIGASETGASNEDSSQKDHEIVITKSFYGVAGDPAKQIDLTAKVQKLVSSGRFTVEGSNEFAGGDPAWSTVKHLVIEYTRKGRPIKKTVPEGVSIDLLTGQLKKHVASGPVKNLWTCFRKKVSLKNAPTRAIARIAVDSKYWLWINGKLVVFEGQLKRGPTPHDTYYDQVDLTRHLRKGDNTIALLVWYFGKHGFSHKSSGKSGLVFNAVVDGEQLLSDRSWKAKIHPSYANSGDPHPNMRLPESNIRFEAEGSMQDWQAPEFDDVSWCAAAEYGKPPCSPWNKLVERPIPLWKDFGLTEYVNASELPKVSDGSKIVAKLPYNAQVTPYFKIEGPAGSLVDIRMDNYNGGGPSNVRAEYVTRAGIQEHESLGWMNGHEMHYTIPAGFKILALKYRETGYNTEFTGTFECDDDFLNRYRQKALRTLYVTMRDTYFDCPDRERAQWWGDMVNEMGEAFYALDPRSGLLAKKGILELANWQRDDNTIFSPVPAGNWDRELPMQMLNSVGYFGFWTYYLYTGDLETIRSVYPAVKRYLSIWKLGADGLVIARQGGWTWGDWGHNKDMTILYNGWYYLALKGQLNMARAVGEQGDVAGIEAKMTRIEQNFNKTFWNGKEYRSPGYNGKTDDRAHALAVVSGLAGLDQYAAIREVFRTQEHSSPYMEKYVGEALYMMRFEGDAIVRTKKRFREMTDHPYTTLWEDWRIGGSGGGTINHAWCGGALTLLSQYGAGVAPVTPGYGTYHVLPQMGPLKRIKTTVPSVKGNIDIEMVNAQDSFTIHLTSPANTVAIVGIPKTSKIAAVEANGRLVWSNGKSKKEPRGLKFQEETKLYIKFAVKPGVWAFKARQTA
jgi:alpha-L-rhamnosidase